MLWQKDRRLKAGGRWECRAKRRVYNQRRAKPDVRPAILEQRHVYWHRAGGGYIQRRRRQLAEQRARITGRLMELEQEAKRLVEP